MDGKDRSVEGRMAATSTLVTEIAGSGEEEHINFFSHTQRVEDVFILIQKWLSRQGVLFCFCARTVNGLLEHHSWYLFGHLVWKIWGVRPLCKGRLAAWELLGQHGNCSGSMASQLVARCPWQAGRHCFEAPSQTAAKRLFPNSVPAHTSDSWGADTLRGTWSRENIEKHRISLVIAAATILCRSL